MVRFCTTFIVPSNAVKKEFGLRHYSKVPDVIYPGVDKKQFSAVSKNQKDSLRDKYHLRGEEKVVCWVGRFSPEKRVKMVVGAAKSLPNIKFILTGFRSSAGSNFNTLPWAEKNKPQNLEIITTAGADKIHEVYQLSDVCVSTSSYETFGSTIYEAAACGITTLVPNHSGVVEAGSEGYIYNYDENSLKDAIVTALERPKMASHIVTCEDNVSQLMTLFNNLVN